MALARIITRSEVCSRELAFHLLGRGYSVEVVSPDSIPASKAELELRVETDSNGKLTANVVVRDGERSASLDFVRETKTSTPLSTLPQALPNLPVTPEVVYFSGGTISKAMHAVAPPSEVPSNNDVSVNPASVEILTGSVVKSVAERKAEHEEVATSAVTPSLPPLASEPSRLLAASSMIIPSPITQSAVPQSSGSHISNNGSTSKTDHSPAVAVSQSASMPPKAISPAIVPSAPAPTVVSQKVSAFTPDPVAAATSFPSAVSPRSSVTSPSAERLGPKRAIPRYRRFGRVPSLVGTVAMTWTAMALLLTLAIGLSLRSNSALKDADKTSPPSAGPATVTEEKKQTPAAPTKEAKEIERHSGAVAPLSTAPATQPEQKSDPAPQVPSVKKVALQGNEIREVMSVSTQSPRPQGHGESLVAADTVTYVDSQVKKTGSDKLSGSQAQRSGVIAQNTVTYVNAAPGAQLQPSAKPAK
jgi:hypothetical protein